MMSAISQTFASLIKILPKSSFNHLFSCLFHVTFKCVFLFSEVDFVLIWCYAVTEISGQRMSAILHGFGRRFQVTTFDIFIKNWFQKLCMFFADDINIIIFVIVLILLCLQSVLLQRWPSQNDHLVKRPWYTRRRKSPKNCIPLAF